MKEKYGHVQDAHRFPLFEMYILDLLKSLAIAV